MKYPPFQTKAYVLKAWSSGDGTILGGSRNFEIGNWLEKVGCQDHVPVGYCTLGWALLSSCSPRDDYHVLHYPTAIIHILMVPAETEAMTMGWNYQKGELKLKSFPFGSHFSRVLSYLWPHLQEKWCQWDSIICNINSLVLIKLVSTGITWQTELTLVKEMRRNQGSE